MSDDMDNMDASENPVEEEQISEDDWAAAMAEPR